MSIARVEIAWSRVEATAVLRHLRARREAMYADLLALEERRHGGEDGAINGALLAVHAELGLLDDAIREVWHALLDPIEKPP